MLTLLGVCCLAATLSAASPVQDDAARLEFFEKKIRPMLVSHCYTCHSADTKPSGNLRVDDRNGLLTGGNSGPAVVPGDPDKSLLLKRVTLKEGKVMPAEGKRLTAEQIADLTTWIRDGAEWPKIETPASLTKPRPDFEKLKKEHWAWQPLTDPKPPSVKDAAWPKDDIDRFILARLEAKGLQPMGDAEKTMLLRRITFDLTGLPPKPAEIDAFFHDQSADAFDRVVDRLLASPQFGERWGRHWLDVARYGESTGPSRNIPLPQAWRYRDYVIDAVNADIPFDRFVQEQIAGDLLPAQSNQERDRLNTATGFLALGPKDVNQRFKVRFIMDNVDEQIDAVARSVLALTVTCARCHDHKYDPIPSTDYYALAGIFTSTENCAGVRSKMGGGGLDYYDPSMLVKLTVELPAPPADVAAKLQAELAEAKQKWDAIRDTPEGLEKGPDGKNKQLPFRQKFEKLQSEFTALTDPVARGHAAHAVREAKTVADTQIRIRGEAEKLGPSVPRGFLTTFDVPGAVRVNASQSGRLELAGWLTSPRNPLAPRVLVNRVWGHLFGQGIVSTVDNFGVTGAPPSHPELLDHLANRFIRDGWSVKKLVRTIVLTRAYQLSSIAESKGEAVFRAAYAADPANRLVWRHSPRRLDAEEIRDATLAAAGTLDMIRPLASPARELKMIEMNDNGPEARTINDKADGSTFRSVYLPLLRGVVPHALEAFDPVEQSLVTGARDATTVPGQALYMLNSTFVQRQSLALAERLYAEKSASQSARVARAYQLVLGRSPTEKEIHRAEQFLKDYESAYPSPKASAPPKDPKGKDGPKDNVNAIQPKDARAAAWLAFGQALFASVEFRFVR